MTSEPTCVPAPDKTGRVAILDLDGGLPAQRRILDGYCPDIVPMPEWGPRIRLGCTGRVFRAFAGEVDRALSALPSRPGRIVLYGSGDFHHVTLALLERQTGPCNLLMLDKHPDWMRHVPVLHCGSWLNHAARLPLVRHVFHVGGETDFDNAYRFLAPRDLLRTERIRVFPAIRSFRGGFWGQIPSPPLRERPDQPAAIGRIRTMFQPFAADLAAYPLYVTVDKDVLATQDATTNWDAGHLLLEEVLATLTVFLDLAGGRLAGADLLGDFSPIRASTWSAKGLAWLHGPRLETSPDGAGARNEQANLRILERLCEAGC
jgi:hypothetical protein